MNIRLRGLAALLGVLLCCAPALHAQQSSPSPSDTGNPGGTATPSDASPPSDSTSPNDSGDSNITLPYSTDLSGVQPGVEGLNRVHVFPPDSFGESPSGIPYSSVLAPTGIDSNNISTFTHPVNTYYPGNSRIGGAEGSFLFTLGNPDFAVPFLRASGEPDDANIKAGPFYVKFHSVDGLVLYDDNFNASEHDRKAETLVLLRLNMTVFAQLSESLQFAVTGYVGYLPIQNQVGVQTNVYGLLGLLATGPLIAAQFVYDTVIAGWPVRFADDFRVTNSYYSDSILDNSNFFSGDYLERENSGTYVFAARPNSQNNNSSNIDSDDLSVITFSNIVSAVTDRYLPGDVRLTLRAEHQDLWYNQDNRGLPPSRDDFYASLVSERENERFKPYASYEAAYVNFYPGVTQIGRAGFLGPIDDQLFLRGEAGYYTTGNDHQGVLWRASLEHEAGPYTFEELVADRDLNYFFQEERTSEYYMLTQTLGPTLRASLFLANSTYRELINDGVSSRIEDLGGLRLLWLLGPKTTLETDAIAERQHFSEGQKANTLTARIVFDRVVTDTLTMQLLYEYERVSSNRPGESYFENVVYFRIIKYLE